MYKTVQNMHAMIAQNVWQTKLAVRSVGPKKAQRCLIRATCAANHVLQGLEASLEEIATYNLRNAAKRWLRVLSIGCIGCTCLSNIISRA